MDSWANSCHIVEVFAVAVVADAAVGYNTGLAEDLNKDTAVVGIVADTGTDIGWSTVTCIGVVSVAHNLVIADMECGGMTDSLVVVQRVFAG